MTNASSVGEVVELTATFEGADGGTVIDRARSRSSSAKPDGTQTQPSVVRASSRVYCR